VFASNCAARETDRGVPAAAVEEDLDISEDLGPEFGLGRPAAAVDELLLEPGEEAFGDGVDAPMSTLMAGGGR
jgi:hypothetical protein